MVRAAERHAAEQAREDAAVVAVRLVSRVPRRFTTASSLALKKEFSRSKRKDTYPRKCFSQRNGYSVKNMLKNLVISGSWLVVSRYCWLVVGCWLVVSVCWLLVVGCWLVVSG